jgi:hypothetical protein
MKLIGAASVLRWSLFLTCSVASAQEGIYKWTDSKGRIHFSNAPTNTEAQSVDETLPPASAFGTQPDTTSAVTASTDEPPPSPAAPPPPSQPEEIPPFTTEPEAEATDEPGLPAEGPLAVPEPSASADLPLPTESSDAEQDEPGPEDEPTAEDEFESE